jgi:hypothetical protein
MGGEKSKFKIVEENNQKFVYMCPDDIGGKKIAIPTPGKLDLNQVKYSKHLIN